MGDIILFAIRQFGERLAMEDPARRVSYRELGERIAHALAALRSAGLERGDTVAQLSGNSVNMFALMAAAYVGGYRSLTMHTMGGAEDQAYILRDSAARLLVFDAEHGERAVALSQLVGTPARCHDDHGAAPLFWEPGCDNLRLPDRATGEWEDLVRLAYTGGTTGRPKGVMLSNRSLVTNTRLALAGIDWPAQVRFLCPAPISHGAGSLVVPTLAQGGTVILQRGFSAAAFRAAMRERAATVTWLVPTMIQTLLDDQAGGNGDFSNLRTLVYSGAPMAPTRIAQAVAQFGPILVQCYGQTEAPNTILTLDKAAHAAGGVDRLASAGKPFPGVEVAILDDDGEEVDVGIPGEICVRGPLLMSGYLGQPDATDAAMAGGWLHTGDVGFLDEAGFFTIVDRKKDMLITGGFNVYPKEVEDIIARHPDVMSVAVFGVPDPKWGEAVRALVVPRANAAIEP